MLPPPMSRWSRQCGILNISKPYRPPGPVTGIALLFFFLHFTFYYWLHLVAVGKITDVSEAHTSSNFTVEDRGIMNLYMLTTLPYISFCALIYWSVSQDVFCTKASLTNIFSSRSVYMPNPLLMLPYMRCHGHPKITVHKSCGTDCNLPAFVNVNQAAMRLTRCLYQIVNAFSFPGPSCWKHLSLPSQIDNFDTRYIIFWYLFFFFWVGSSQNSGPS
jgi:hypothetical protein